MDLEDMKDFFDKAGITETQLNDENTRNFIVEFIQNNGGASAVKEDLNVAPDDDSNYEVVIRDNTPPPVPIRNSIINPPVPPIPAPRRLIQSTIAPAENKDLQPSPQVKDKRRITKDDICLGEDFRHVSHVGWDPKKGFDIECEILEEEEMEDSESNLNNTNDRNFKKPPLPQSTKEVKNRKVLDPLERPSSPPPTPPPRLPEGSLKNAASSGRRNMRREKITKADIGFPQDFRHVAHVGWDANKGFDIDTLEPQPMSDFFNKWGVSEKPESTNKYTHEELIRVMSAVPTNNSSRTAVNNGIQDQTPPPVPARDYIKSTPAKKDYKKTTRAPLPPPQPTPRKLAVLPTPPDGTVSSRQIPVLEPLTDHPTQLSTPAIDNIPNEEALNGESELQTNFAEALARALVERSNPMNLEAVTTDDES